MAELIAFNQKRFFTLREAQRLLPVVRRITQASCEEVKKVGTQINLISDRMKRKNLEERVYWIFQKWQEKIRKLGGEAKGMWLVDFDAGDGYYCWRYPEPTIDYFHGYTEGYQGRVKIH